MQGPGGLQAAQAALESSLSRHSPNSVQVISEASAACCAEINRNFQSPPAPQSVELVVSCLASLNKAIVAISQRATTGEQKLAALRAQFWQYSLFPTLESCCFNERWHTLVLQADTTPNRSTHASFQSVTKDLIKDSLVPLLAAACAAQTTEFILLPHLEFLVRLATQAAAFIGFRDPRVNTHPYLRNYGLVNGLWLGVLNCWWAVPAALWHQQQPSSASISPVSVIISLIDFLQKDLLMLCDRKEPTDVKLLQFWLVNIAKFMNAFPEATSVGVFDSTSDWEPSARQLVAQLEAEGTPQAIAVVQAVQSGSLWARIARLKMQALAAAAKVSDENLSSRMAKAVENLALCRATSIPTNTQPATHLAITADLIAQTSVLPAPLRTATLPVLQEALSSALVHSNFAFAVQSAEKCQHLADCYYSCILTIAQAAAAHPNVDTLVAAWEDAQLLLMECAMKPHPAMMSVLSSLFASLIPLSDNPTVKNFIAALHELAATTAAVEAAAEIYQFPSETLIQLIQLLGIVLGSAPVQISEGFCAKFLQFDSQQAVSDRCRLAAMAALLRSVAVADRPSCCISALALVKKLCSALQQRMKTPLASNNDVLVIAHLVDCLGGALTCLSAFTPSATENLNTKGPSPDELEAAVTAVASRSLALLQNPQAMATPCVVPALMALSTAWKLHPGCLTSSQVESLLVCLEKLLQNPAAAAGIASLTPALRDRPQPPRLLFKALLGHCASPTLQFLGKEAYVAYARECSNEENVHNALPDQWRDPTTRQPTDAARLKIQSHLQRTATTQTVELDTRVSVELENVAVNAPFKLKEAALHAAAYLPTPQQQREGEGGTITKDGVVNSAVDNVMDAVNRLKAVWPRNGGGAGETAMAVRNARDVLTALLLGN